MSKRYDPLSMQDQENQLNAGSQPASNYNHNKKSKILIQITKQNIFYFVIGFIVSFAIMVALSISNISTLNKQELKTYQQQNKHKLEIPIQRQQSQIQFQASRGRQWDSQLISTVLSTYILHTQEQYFNIQKFYYGQKYRTHEFKQTSFCIVVPTFNNQLKNRALINLQSIVAQEYENYRAIIIDDASTDNTYQIIDDFYNKLPPHLQRKITVRRNEKNKKALQNIYEAAHDFCDAEDIMTIVDGDDFLIGRQVLKLFNAVYQKNDVWLVYSNFLMREGLPGYSGPYPRATIQNKRFRYYTQFLMSHQHTFYTELFRKIRIEDLKDKDGQWLSTAYDLAIYFPMAQMAKKRMMYLAEFTYYYNVDTGLNDHIVSQQSQIDNTNMIRKKRVYNTLQKLYPNVKPKKDEKIII